MCIYYYYCWIKIILNWIYKILFLHIFKSSLIFKNKRKIKCGNYFINGAEKGFYTDLYFLVLYQDGKDRNKIFEELIEKILRIIKIKKIN